MTDQEREELEQEGYDFSLQNLADELGIPSEDFEKWDDGAYDDMPIGNRPEWVRQLDEYMDRQSSDLDRLIEQCKEAG